MLFARLTPSMFQPTSPHVVHTVTREKWWAAARLCALNACVSSCLRGWHSTSLVSRKNDLRGTAAPWTGEGLPSTLCQIASASRQRRHCFWMPPKERCCHLACYVASPFYRQYTQSFFVSSSAEGNGRSHWACVSGEFTIRSVLFLVARQRTWTVTGSQGFSIQQEVSLCTLCRANHCVDVFWTLHGRA